MASDKLFYLGGWASVKTENQNLVDEKSTQVFFARITSFRTPSLANAVCT